MSKQVPVFASTEAESITFDVVQALADAKGIDPEQLDPPLGEVIDTDALDGLYDASSRRVGTAPTVSFTYDGIGVFIDEHGDVFVSETRHP